MAVFNIHTVVKLFCRRITSSSNTFGDYSVGFPSYTMAPLLYWLYFVRTKPHLQYCLIPVL